MDLNFKYVLYWLKQNVSYRHRCPLRIFSWGQGRTPMSPRDGTWITVSIPSNILSNCPIPELPRSCSWNRWACGGSLDPAREKWLPDKTGQKESGSCLKPKLFQDLILYVVFPLLSSFSWMPISASLSRILSAVSKSFRALARARISISSSTS